MTRADPIPISPTPADALAGVSPEAAIERWPADRPLAALVSADDPGDDLQSRDGSSHAAAPPAGRPRWSILGAPTRSLRLLPRDLDPGAPLAPLRVALDSTSAGAPVASRGPGPSASGWIGLLSYELGGLLEPRARRPGAPEPTAPLVELHHCPGVLVHDRVEDRWSVGDAEVLAAIGEAPDGATRARGAFTVGPARSELGRASYESAAARAIEYIRAGDVFQVNIAHALEAPFAGDPRAMFTRLVREARPWYGAYFEPREPERPGGSSRPSAPPPPSAVCSISPELFLEFDARTRRVVTRPIKGTIGAGVPEGVLRDSAKDAAELVMIVDLMRNDLGRVCEPGTIRVVEARRIERHAGVRHGVATVEGVLREGLDRVDLIRAAFPAGSITGAPKVRAMQIINELEPSARGPYCGAIGWFGDDGSMTLNVAIRTACVSGGAVRYNVGAGIVADSDPAKEWVETLHKAEGFLRAVGSSVVGAGR